MAEADILIVDDDPSTIRAIGAILLGKAKLRIATNGRDALAIARDSVPDLILLDAEMPDMSGFAVCEAIKADAELAAAAVIFITSHSESEFEATSLEMGAADFIGKPFDARVVLARVMAQLRAKERRDALLQATLVDTVTGLANRRGFDIELEREWLRARRHAGSVTVIVAAADQFDLFRERYGDAAHEKALIAMGKVIKRNTTEPNDLAAYLGGGKFGLLLPHLARRGAEHVGQSVVAEIAALGIINDSTLTRPNLSMSVGIASHDPGGSGENVYASPLAQTSHAVTFESAAQLKKLAELALTAASTSGGDQAHVLDAVQNEKSSPAPRIRTLRVS